MEELSEYSFDLTVPDATYGLLQRNYSPLPAESGKELDRDLLDGCLDRDDLEVQQKPIVETLAQQSSRISLHTIQKRSYFALFSTSSLSREEIGRSRIGTSWYFCADRDVAAALKHLLVAWVGPW